MNRNRRDMEWTFAIRSNPIQTDPAPIVTDPNGSYTGRPREAYEKPVQDANDL